MGLSLLIPDTLYSRVAFVLQTLSNAPKGTTMERLTALTGGNTVIMDIFSNLLQNERPSIQKEDRK